MQREVSGRISVPLPCRRHSLDHFGPYTGFSQYWNLACQHIAEDAVVLLQRTDHPIRLGIRHFHNFLQCGTCPGSARPGGDEPCSLVQAIEAKALGLSRFGRRAWLDDPLRADDRVEVLCPILADAKAARFARVAKSRAERTDGRWGRRGVADRQIRATKRPSEG